MMRICIWQIAKLRMFKILLMNRNRRSHIPQEKNMSLLSMFGTVVFVVFFCLLCSCCCLGRCKNCWLWIMRWWYFDDNMCRTIVYRPKIVNTVSTADDGHRGLTVSLLSRAHAAQDRQGEPPGL